MQELAWLFEPIRIWLEGGSWREISTSPGFVLLMFSVVALIPASVILVGIGGWEEWRKTPLAMRFGVSSDDPDAGWAERARDLDKDGTPDF